MVARFSECAVVSNWLPHTPVQIFFRLVLVHKTIWCSLSSFSIQTRVLAGTFYITLLSTILDPLLSPSSIKNLCKIQHAITIVGAYFKSTFKLFKI